MTVCKYCINQEFAILFVHITRNSITWLNDKFFINNGLPHLIIEGKYSYLNKEVAVTEYKNAVFASSISSNESLFEWFKSIISAGFSVSSPTENYVSLRSS